MARRRDQKNLDRLFAHGKRVNHGTSWVEITWHEGWIAKYKIEKVVEGSQAPLEKIEDKEDD